MFANRTCEKNIQDALLPDQQLSWQTSGVVYSEGHYMCPRCSCWQCGSGYDAKYSPVIKYNPHDFRVFDQIRHKPAFLPTEAS